EERLGPGPEGGLRTTTSTREARLDGRGLGGRLGLALHGGRRDGVARDDRRGERGGGRIRAGRVRRVHRIRVVPPTRRGEVELAIRERPHVEIRLLSDGRSARVPGPGGVRRTEEVDRAGNEDDPFPDAVGSDYREGDRGIRQASDTDCTSGGVRPVDRNVPMTYQ